MPKKYHHLTYEQRCQIDALLQRKISRSEIARQLGVNRPGITRELARNQCDGKYNYETAHKAAVSRRQTASSTPIKMLGERPWFIEYLLEKWQWSPDQVSGWLRRAGVQVSHETIYRHIWADKKKGGKLWTNLRHRGKKCGSARRENRRPRPYSRAR